MSHNNQSGNFFYWLTVFACLCSEFFLLTGLKSLEILCFKLQIYFLVESVQFFFVAITSL